MARARGIKPGFYKNDVLAECSVWARFIFPGLWMLADREGRLEDRPKRIKGELLPFDSVEVDQLLDELQSRGFILRYEVGGLRLIQIITFSKHQNPHHREPPSDLPPPQSPGLDPVGNLSKPEATGPYDEPKARGKPEASPGNDPQESTWQGGRAVLTPDSGLLTPDSGEKHSPGPPGATAPERATTSDGFEQFWAAYPRKCSKGQAKRAWARLKPDAALLDRILRSVAKAKAREDWRKEGGRFVPYPATWLNAEGWEDEPETSIAGVAGAQWWLASGHGTREAAIAAGVREPLAHTRISEPA